MLNTSNDWWSTEIFQFSSILETGMLSVDCGKGEIKSFRQNQKIEENSKFLLIIKADNN